MSRHSLLDHAIVAGTPQNTFTDNNLSFQMANPTSRGQQRDKPFRDALRMELAALGEDSKALREIARSLITAASEGKMDAIKEIGDRMDGKPAQAVIGGEEGDPEIKVSWLTKTPLTTTS